MWLGLHFPELGLEVFEVSEDVPTALVEEQRVVAINAAAGHAGIVCGSTLATARSVCATLAHHIRDPERELDRLRALGEAMYRFSALVSLEAPAGLTLEVAGSRKLHGDLETLMTDAEQLARAHGHRCTARLAPTPGAALLQARAACDCLEAVPLSTALPSKQVEQLASMGMHQLGTLLELPEAELGQRLGAELIDFLGRLEGRLPDPREGIVLAPQFLRTLNLLDPIREKQTLLFPMQRLLTELESWLIGRQLCAEQLIWRFASGHGRPAEREPGAAVAGEAEMTVRFGAGRQLKEAFLPITRLKLDRLELPEDVISLSLEATALSPFDTGSHGLFEALPGDPTADVAGLMELLDELRARLGDKRCHGIESAAEHVPERAWRPVWKPGRRRSNASAGRRFIEQTSKRLFRRHPPGAVAGEATKIPMQSRSRPAWLFAEPRVVSPERLTLLGGPERIQTVWWRQGLSRDYYLARLDSGACCWAFVDHEERWFVHGYFA